MKTTLTIIALALVASASLNAQTTTTKKSNAVVRIDTHPENIIEHYKWCVTVKSLKTQTARLRDFFEDHRPKNSEYDDSIHSRLVLRSAYQLTENYCRLKWDKNAVAMLRWIRSEDYRLIKEER